MIDLFLSLILAADQVVLDNEYVHVTRSASWCAAANTPDCGFRVIVALDDLVLAGAGSSQRMTRGDVAVFQPDESYEPPASSAFIEVAIKPNHPPAQFPTATIAPQKNALCYDGKDFFVFEERLAPGDTRPRHSHSERVVIQLNQTRLRQWPDGGDVLLIETTPERVSFNSPVVHAVQNVGDTPLRGIVIEFKPGLVGTTSK